MLLIPLICCIILGAAFVFASDASPGWKLSVSLLVIASLVIKFMFPKAWLFALLLQAALSVAILFYMKVHR